MQTFAENQKATQQPPSAQTAAPDRPQFGQAHEASYVARAGGSRGVPRLPAANPGNGNGDPRTAGMAHFGHDFNHIAVHSNPAGNSPARETIEPARGIRERVHAAGVIAARTALRPHEGSPATLRREADIYAQDKTPIRVGDELAAWDAKPLGAPETGAHLREIQRQFGPEGVERSVRGLAQTRGEQFAHNAAEHAGFSPAARSPDGGAIGQQAAGAIRASNASGPLPDDVREKLTNATSAISRSTTTRAPTTPRIS